MHERRVIALPALLLLSACGGGHGLARVVHSGESARVRAGEGVVLIASEQAPRVDLLLCLDGDRGRCADVGPTQPDGALEVYVLPAGRYCVMHVSCEATLGVVAEHDVPADEVRCFDVAADHIAYPGHVIFDRSAASGDVCAGRADWLPHETVDADLDATYPNLNGPRVTITAPTQMQPRS